VVFARACGSSDLLPSGWRALLLKKEVPAAVAAAGAGAGGDAGAAKVSLTV
jgi:hypothetical protein